MLGARVVLGQRGREGWMGGLGCRELRVGHMIKTGQDSVSFFLSLSLNNARPSFEYYRQVYFAHFAG